MTLYQVFINELTHLALNYLKAIGCSVEDTYYINFNLYSTKTKDIIEIFDSLIKEAEREKRTGRSNLIKYVVKAIESWRDSVYNSDIFLNNREDLESSVSEFLITLGRLLKTYSTDTINIDSKLGKYELIGLYQLKTSRGYTAGNNFFKAINLFYSKPEDIKHMFEHHQLNIQRVAAGINTELEATRTELLRLKQVISELEQSKPSEDTATQTGTSKPFSLSDDTKAEASSAQTGQTSETKDLKLDLLGMFRDPGTGLNGTPNVHQWLTPHPDVPSSSSNHKI